MLWKIINGPSEIWHLAYEASVITLDYRLEPSDRENSHLAIYNMSFW